MEQRQEEEETIDLIKEEEQISINIDRREDEIKEPRQEEDTIEHV